MFLLMLCGLACLLGLGYLAGGDGDGGNSGDDDPKPGTKNDDPKPGITQADLDRMLDSGFAKGKAQADKQVGELQDQVKDLSTKLEAFIEKKATDDGDFKGVADAQRRKAEEAISELAEFRKKYTLSLAKTEVLAVAGDCVNPETLFKLISDQIVVKDDGSVEVPGHASVKDFVESYLKENTFLLKPTGSSGSGSPGSTVPKPTKGNEAAVADIKNAKTDAELAEAIKKHKGGVASHQVQQ